MSEPELLLTPQARLDPAHTAVVVVETDQRVEPNLALERRTSRRYGSARVTVYG